MIRIPTLLFNRRLLAILAFGFASGLPVALVGSTLQAWFTQDRIDLITIGTLSLIGIPYTLKFLWAPLMDYYQLPWLDKRRSWILLMQLGLLIALFILANMSPMYQATQMAVIALAIAFFSASQDIAVTAYQTDSLTEHERGMGVAYYVLTYRLAGLISGGLALISADYFGWKITYEFMAISILICMMFTCYAPKVENLPVTSSNVVMTMFDALRDLLQRDRIVLLVLFIIFYKFGDAFAFQLMTNFLLHGLDFSLSQVGVAYKFVGFVATILGAFVGGVFLTRWNIYKALLVFGLAQTFSNLMFVVLAMVGHHFGLMVLTMFIENFCGGLSTAALFAFLMSLCNHHYSATQFALLSAIASLGRVFTGPLAGVMVKNVGWVQFYIWAFVLCFPGLIFLMLLKSRVNYVEATAD